ncbi:hypothetical protein COS75_02130 [Candidatus Pacearchaeota archaeon CG06_land_8_20_14_3_00_35_12]|nr:MAG: hypothetical protein COS75_02130 [Candidatus Pacearchaeota archaeon CG06_land_8_20_14_3_00_35_12]
MDSKEQLEKLQRDEAGDMKNLQAAMSEVSDARKLAARLSNELSSKYGLEFGGWVKLDYDIFEKIFTMSLANGHSFIFDYTDILDIPSKIMFLRKEQLIKKIKMEKKKNETDFAIHSV